MRIFAESELHDGDRLTLGESESKVRIVAPESIAATMRIDPRVLLAGEELRLQAQEEAQAALAAAKAATPAPVAPAAPAVPAVDDLAGFEVTLKPIASSRLPMPAPAPVAPAPATPPSPAAPVVAAPVPRWPRPSAPAPAAPAPAPAMPAVVAPAVEPPRPVASPVMPAVSAALRWQPSSPSLCRSRSRCRRPRPLRSPKHPTRPRKMLGSAAAASAASADRSSAVVCRERGPASRGVRPARPGSFHLCRPST